MTGLDGYYDKVRQESEEYEAQRKTEALRLIQESLDKVGLAQTLLDLMDNPSLFRIRRL